MLKQNCLNFLILSMGFALTFSCAKSNKNDLKEAQLCLNDSVPSTARACLEKISSDTSAQANKLRCAGVFISEGFNTPSSFTAALTQLNGTGSCTGGCSATVNALNSLNFHNGDNNNSTNRDRNAAVSLEAFTYCSQAETNIYMQISSLFRIGTLAANAAYALNGGSTPTPDQMEAAISSLPAADVGAIVVTTYNSSCKDTTSASEEIKKYCTELGTAVNSGGTQTQIGTCLQNKLANPNFTCPQY